MKIAIGGLAIECCSFSPLMTTLDDIDVRRGDALLSLYPFLKDYVDLDIVPIVRGKATSGGPVTLEAYRAILDELLDGLRHDAPWDGVYLDLHGALFVGGQFDAEGALTAAVREVVGPKVLIATSYDLHGNLSKKVVDNIDILTAYRTAPHIDVEATRERAFYLMVTALQTATRPVTRFVSVPMLLPGEVAMTTTNPAQNLYEELPDIIQSYNLLDASYLVGYAWADEPRVCAAAVAVGDAERAEQSVIDMAERWWKLRQQFQFEMPTGSVEACLKMAQVAGPKERPFFISDAGDNITGGGVGDIPLMLEHMLAANTQNSVYAAIADAEAVNKCGEALGETVSLTVGGKLDTRHGIPLHISGRVIALYGDTQYGRQVVMQVEGVRVILTERRVPFISLGQFDNLGIDLRKVNIVGIKLGYLFPELRAIAGKSVLALTPGAINPDVHAIDYHHIQRPIYPLDEAMDWTPTSD
ncbi:MAG: M81 family metallopeptidase [Aggregatilineales bacterium]